MNRKNNWFILGDLHGRIGPIEAFYRQNKERLDLDHSDNHMILLGDVGANFTLSGQRDYLFKQALSEMPFTYVCLRGNHEARVQMMMDRNPDGWEAVSRYSGKIYVEKEFPNIEYLDDGPAVYEFSGYKTLSLPGAYSVDKWYRLKMHWAWYADEQLTDSEMEYGRALCKKQEPFDLVISHTCPSVYVPRDLFLPGVDQRTVDTSMERFLGEIEYNLAYKRWAFGHFHADRLYPRNNGKQMLMLFNENTVDLGKFMKMQEGSTFEDVMV